VNTLASRLWPTGLQYKNRYRLTQAAAAADQYLLRFFLIICAAQIALVLCSQMERDDNYSQMEGEHAGER